MAEDNQSAQVLINLEGLIKSHISSIDKIQEELKKHKEMLEDTFNSDETYQEHLKIANEAAKVKNKTRQEILKRPGVGELDNKVKSLKSQVKETKGALSDYLKEFQGMSGVNEIEGEDGEIREIVFEAKLVKKSSKGVY